MFRHKKGLRIPQSQSIEGNEVQKWKTLYGEHDAIIEPLQDRVILLEAELNASIEGIVGFVLEWLKLNNWLDFDQYQKIKKSDIIKEYNNGK